MLRLPHHRKAPKRVCLENVVNVRNFKIDGSRSLDDGLQEQLSNHLMVRLMETAGVLSDKEKRKHWISVGECIRAERK